MNTWPHAKLRRASTMTNKPATSSNVAQLISRANLTGLLLDLMEMTAVCAERRETGWQAKVFLHGGSRREHGNHQTEAHEYHFFIDAQVHVVNLALDALAKFIPE